MGPCNVASPSVFAVEGRARWKAWATLGAMTKEEASQKYIDAVSKQAPKWRTTVPSLTPSAATSPAHKKSVEAKSPALGAAVTPALVSVPPLAPVVLSTNLPQAKAETYTPATIGEVLDSKEISCVYLITGATGFVGKHLIERLLARPNSIILTITRPVSVSKLYEMASERYGVGAKRIFCLPGDITKPFCGLSEDMLGALKGKVHHFFHLAAKYDMTATDEENFASNVDGTKYATDVINSVGGVYHYTSSIAVAGDFNGIFFETMFNEGQLFDHSYLESKFKGEEYARNNSKVPIRIYRPGMIVGSSKTGEAGTFIFIC